jgi:hypothetical protein
MTSFEVSFGIDGIFGYSLDKETCELIGLRLTSNTSLLQTTATMTVEAANETNAVLEAKRKVDAFLGLFYVYSTDVKEILSNHQISVKDLSSSKVNHRVNVYMMPEKDFSQDDFRHLQTTYYELILDSKNAYLTIALDYFRMARLDSRPANKIIDYFVALEALYGKEEEKTEMRYRFSNRIATMLGKDPADRKIMIQRARTLYDKRSITVHGSSTELEKSDLPTLHKWVRESILRFLVLAKSRPSHAAIVDEIDLAMLDNPLRDRMRTDSELLIGLILE